MKLSPRSSFCGAIVFKESKEIKEIIELNEFREKVFP